MNHILDIQSLGKTFKGKGNDLSVKALHDLTLQVATGSIFGFVGPNGAGKSTAIKILMGFIKATQGVASIRSIPVTLEQCRHNIGYLPEHPAFHDFLTAREVLETTASLRSIKKQSYTKTISHLLKRVNLPDTNKRPVRTFSKGMTQRLGLANALVGDPTLLILDEPMSGLDPLGRDLVRGLMIELRDQGKTIFFSSHILHDVETICDEVAILVQGKLKFQGKLQDISETQGGKYVAVQFRSSKYLADLKSNLGERCSSLRHLNTDIFEFTTTQANLPLILQNLLDLKCQITNVQQDHASLEHLFMQLTEKNTPST